MQQNDSLADGYCSASDLAAALQQRFGGTPTQGKGGCSKMAVSPTAMWDAPALQLPS